MPDQRKVQRLRRTIQAEMNCDPAHLILSGMRSIPLTKRIPRSAENIPFLETIPSMAWPERLRKADTVPPISCSEAIELQALNGAADCSRQALRSLSR